MQGGSEDIAMQMALAVKHRGPDDAGVWCDARAGISIAHQRLSIIDRTAAGHQPMHSASRRYVMAYNGEVYNHQKIRTELEAQGAAPAWAGHSDTETLLAAFEQWGVVPTLNRAVGMFAIALWDVQTSTLHLIRDRFGEKPLYYGWVNGAFAFGSELKALRAYPGFCNSVSREALALYMRFTHVPAPYSIYEDIFKLEPGCVLSINGSVPAAPRYPIRPDSPHDKLVVRRWWSLSNVVEATAKERISTETEAVQLLQEQLQASVRMQLLADVPLGAFLSGGVDSSTIVALMQRDSMRPVKTFTVGFGESGFDETPHAREVARHLGTDHHELYVTAAEAQSVIARLPAIYDEPFADSSQIPTVLVCEAARQQVTVALSGDAGDELFGGYNRYFWGPRIWHRLAWLPHPVRRLLGQMILAVSMEKWDFILRSMDVVRPGEKLHKLTRALTDARNLEDLYLSLVSDWQDPAKVVRGRNGMVTEPPTSLSEPLPSFRAAADESIMMYRDSRAYLPDDILCKVDRAAMAVSLETREPFLDHRVAELAWRLPTNMKIRGGQGKWALRQVLYQYVPRELIERPKAGFAIPVGQWLRGALRDWAEGLLNERRLHDDGYFHPAPIRQRWAEHLSGRHDHTGALWAVLMFQAWLDESRTAGCV